MSQDPILPHPDDHPETVSRNARRGLLLFVIYVSFYGYFVVHSAFAKPEEMREPFLAGVNRPIVYGMGLIVVAFVLALIYMVLCRGSAADSKK